MAYSYVLGEIFIPLWLYSVAVFILSILILSLFGYMAYIYWWDGAALNKFFMLRLRSIADKRITLFEIFSLNSSVSLEEARREAGDGYRLLSNIKPKPKRDVLEEYIVNKLHLKRFVKIKNIPQQDTKTNNVIIPKSTYSINGVRTIPLFDLHPTMHKDIIKGLDLCLENNIKTIQEYEDKMDINPDDTFFDKYTYKTWYDLYISTRNKYEVKVTASDIIKAMNSIDNTFRESIKAKNYNVKQKKKLSGDIDKYGKIIVVIAAVVIAIRIIYLTFWR